MASRKVIVGCAGILVFMAALATVAGVLAYARLSATVPLPDVAAIIGEETHGFAVLTLHADDPWIADLIEQSDPKRRGRADLLPLELSWVGFRAPDGSDGHALRLAVSPRGRLVASLVDLALWHAGHSGDTNVSRIEHSGEGITAFPGSPVPGLVFVRDTSIVWASSPASARGAVETLAGGTGAAARSLLDNAPDAPGALLRGALRKVKGSMGRTLRSIPGEALDLDDDALDQVEAVSFRFDTTSADEGKGSVEIDFRAGTSAEVVRRVSDDLADRLAALSTSGMILESDSRIEKERAIIRVLATGLQSLQPRILSAPDKLREAFRQFEIRQAGEG